MKSILKELRGGILALGVSGALGFGVLHAFAAPSTASAAAACNQPACNSQCEAQYGEFASGWCNEAGECECAL